MSAEQLTAERDTLAKDIIEMERQIATAHEESGGNSPEDNSQEATQDIINRAQLGEQIGVKRKRMVEVEARIAELNR